MNDRRGKERGHATGTPRPLSYGGLPEGEKYDIQGYKVARYLSILWDNILFLWSIICRNGWYLPGLAYCSFVLFLLP